MSRKGRLRWVSIVLLCIFSVQFFGPARTAWAEEASIQSGLTRVWSYKWSDGRVYMADEKTGVMSFIWDLGLTILGHYYTTVATVLNTLFGIATPTASYAGASVWYSFSWVHKYVEVDTGSGWVVYYEAVSREWHRHFAGTYVDEHGETKMKDPVNQGCYRTEYSPNFNDETWLMNEAYWRWLTGGQPGYEDWTTTFPDPPPVDSVPEEPEEDSEVND